MLSRCYNGDSSSLLLHDLGRRMILLTMFYDMSAIFAAVIHAAARVASLREAARAADLIMACKPLLERLD